MITRKIIFIFTISATIMLSGYSQQIDFSKFGIETRNSYIPKGLKVGDKAPVFTAYDQKGKKVESQKLIEKGPLVIFFYRGKWCPICNKYLNNYQDSIDFIAGQGVTLVGITPESIENVEQTVSNNKLTYTVLYDCEEKIMKDYDVLFNVTKEYQDKINANTLIDIAANNGRDSARLPVPATYIINKAGIIVAAQFNPDYKYRASVKWVLTNLMKAF
jgi:peroxiredoxin